MSGSNWSASSGRSPLGLPMPKNVGRQDIPTLDEIARAQGVTRERGGEEVMHVCFECGGPTAAGLIIVQNCRYCGGTGLLTDEQLSRMFAGGNTLP